MSTAGRGGASQVAVGGGPPPLSSAVGSHELCPTASHRSFPTFALERRPSQGPNASPTGGPVEAAGPSEVVAAAPRPLHLDQQVLAAGLQQRVRVLRAHGVEEPVEHLHDGLGPRRGPVIWRVDRVVQATTRGGVQNDQAVADPGLGHGVDCPTPSRHRVTGHGRGIRDRRSEGRVKFVGSDARPRHRVMGPDALVKSSTRPGPSATFSRSCPRRSTPGAGRP